MTATPFTQELAAEIADDFQDLIDTDFKGEDGLLYVVDSVVTIPFAEAGKQQFIRQYLETKDAEAAITFYAGEDYDVGVFAWQEGDDTKYVCIDIRSFATLHGIPYRFP